MATTTNTPSGTNVTNTPDPTSAAPATDAAATPAGAPDAEAKVTLAELKGIKYTGRSSIRSISAAEFASVGVDTKTDLVWDASNGFVVKTEDVNAAVRDYLAKDSEFELVTD